MVDSGILPVHMTRKNKRKQQKTKRPRNQKPVVALTAETADKHDLYQRSVQDAEVTQSFMDEIFASRSDRIAMTLREDFCGTALLCAQWVKSAAGRTAVGIDLDADTLEWGMTNNVRPLKEDSQRISLLCRDVLEADTKPHFDVIAAFNFSYFIFHQRRILLDYFKNARKALKPGGVLLLDLHGGPDAQFKMEEPTDMGEFDYIWDQDQFCPVTHHTICHIHFHFRDGSKLQKAFTYDWRLWTMPELRDILEESGFRQIDTWFDEDNGNDEYAICETTDNMEAWVGYLAAWK
jgi:SAM-dependent methyltransferase